MTAIARAREAFASRFGRAPDHVIQAPGRVELLGNHTDYNEGLVLSAAIDRRLALAIGARRDGGVCIHSTEEGQETTLDPRALARHRIVPWARYPAAILAGLRARGVTVPGFDAVIASDVPAGAGLGSSAALEVATALAVRALRPFRLAGGSGTELDDAERWELTHLCRTAEREFVGVPCGLLDQVSVLFGAPASVLLLDCRIPSVAGLPLAAAALVVCDSGERHALVHGDYAALATTCASAARTLGVRALRDVSADELARSSGRLGERESECARHVVSEIGRVARAADALRAGDLPTLGRLMTESHASARDLLHNSTDGLDLLVELALAEPGCWGARLTGAGFGGATVSLTSASDAPALARRVTEGFHRRTGRRVAAWCLLAADAAS